MKRIYALVVMLIVLAVFTTRSQASQSNPFTALPVIRAAAGNHPPVILRVVDREEIRNGSVYLHKDIYFTDPGGDAVKVVNKLINSTTPFTVNVSDDEIQASAEDQKGEALVTSTWKCGMRHTLAIDDRILDKAGNLSEPVIVNFSCTAPPVETRPSLTIGLIAGSILGLGLLAASLLLLRHRPAERLPALRSTLLLFCLLFMFRFMQVILHEGGHSLYLLVRGVPITLYVHPFGFSGFYRPMIDFSIWSHILGSAVAIPASLLISLLFWKSRSWVFLPFKMLFPWVALNDGLYIMSVQGDFHNLMQVTGLPAVVFIGVGFLIAITGIFFLFSLLPRLGLARQDRKALFVIPAAFYLWGLASLVAAHLFVPGSPIHTDFFVGTEIIQSANLFIPNTILGAVLGGLYVTLYCWMYPRLPAGLQNDTASLTWKDLHIPALFSTVCLVLGIIIIT